MCGDGRRRNKTLCLVSHYMCIIEINSFPPPPFFPSPILCSALKANGHSRTNIHTTNSLLQNFPTIAFPATLHREVEYAACEDTTSTVREILP